MFISYTNQKTDIVSSRNKLWEIELSMLKMVSEICDRNNICWFMIGGGLIGTIRHKGFIPWDDDIDIGMLRDDYEKFIQVAKQELPEGYELQTCDFAENQFHSLLRIRHNASTGMLSGDIYRNTNSGVFLEIYPYDNDTGVSLKYIRQSNQVKFWVTLLNNYSQSNKAVSVKGKIFAMVCKILCKIIPFEYAVKKWNGAQSKYNNQVTEYVNCEWSTNKSVGTRSRWHTEDIKPTIRLPFENIQVCVPHNYDRCLRICYGDYMKMPSIDEREMHHSTDVAYDPFTPYTMYQNDKKRKELKKLLGN